MLLHSWAMVVLCAYIRQGEAFLEIRQTSISNPKFPNTLTHSAWSVSVAIMISRVLGLVREIVLARYFGAGMFTDAFYIAYRIPNLLRDLFAEGALSAAFIPIFVRRLTLDGKEQAWLLANRLISTLLVLLGIVTLAIFFGARGFVYLLAAGYTAIPEKFELTVQMTQIMSPFLLWISLASVGMGMLNAFGRFFVPALASSAFNICCILAGIFLSPFMSYFGVDPIVSMAIGALVGGASQFLVMIPSAYVLGFRFRLAFNFSDPELRRIGRLMFPAIVGLSATQINIMVDNQIASMYGNGPVSWLSYGFRLMQLPIGVFGIAIATATLATVSHHAAQNALNKVGQTLNSSLKLAACLTFPSTIGLILFRQEIVQLLFQGGSFLPADTLNTSNVVLCYALGLFSYSAVKILVPTLYALRDTRSPLRFSMLTVASKILLNFILIKHLGFLGLALATTIASWINYGLLLNHVRHIKGVSWGKTNLSAYMRVALASLVMGLIALLVFHLSSYVLPGSETIPLALKLGLAILASLISLVPLLRLFQVEEAEHLLKLLATSIRKFR
jgi:putative peptidoglycan lipid II flippase